MIALVKLLRDYGDFYEGDQMCVLDEDHDSFQGYVHQHIYTWYNISWPKSLTLIIHRHEENFGDYYPESRN